LVVFVLNGLRGKLHFFRIFAVRGVNNFHIIFFFFFLVESGVVLCEFMWKVE
jgi:hypothetical protein